MLVGSSVAEQECHFDARDLADHYFVGRLAVRRIGKNGLGRLKGVWVVYTRTAYDSYFWHVWEFL